MAFINLLSILELIDLPFNIFESLWRWLILDVFYSWIPDYGWCVIVFTLVLKLALSPIDIYQRIQMKKNQRITEKLKPEIEKLEAQYKDNPQALQQKKTELNKKNGVKRVEKGIPEPVEHRVLFLLRDGVCAVFITHILNFFFVESLVGIVVLDEQGIRGFQRRVEQASSHPVRPRGCDLVGLFLFGHCKPSFNSENQSQAQIYESFESGSFRNQLFIRPNSALKHGRAPRPFMP